MSSSSEEDMDVDSSIEFHEAKIIVDSRCFVYKTQVLNKLEVNDTVRISFTLESPLDTWAHDTPFVKILQINPDTNILGEIMNINRQETDKYPLNVGEKIWFKKNNIIEIVANRPILKNLLTSEKVVCTGPLFTIVYDDSDESDSESESDENASDSD